MVSLGDEQDPWAPRGREERHGSSCPLSSIPNCPGKAADLLVEQVQELLYVQELFLQLIWPSTSRNNKIKGGSTISGSQARISLQNLLALLAGLCVDCAGPHRGRKALWMEMHLLCSCFMGEMINSCRKKSNAVCLWGYSVQGQCQASSDLSYHLRPVGSLHYAISECLQKYWSWYCWGQGNLPVLPGRSLQHHTAQAGRHGL